MIVVFCKYYNDLDQIVPVVYELARHGRKDIEMVLLDPVYDLESDFRIDFLRREFGVEVSYYHKDSCVGKLKPFILLNLIYGPVGVAFMRNIVRLARLGGHKFQKSVENGVRRFPGKLARKWFGSDYAKCFLSKRNISVIISDNRPRPLKLYETAKSMGIPIIGLPHGLNSSVDEISIAKKNVSKGTAFNHLVFAGFATQFDNEKQRYIDNATPAQKVKVLGSTRYCKEWRDVYKTIMPKPLIGDEARGNRKLRVVFMDHSSKYRMVAQEIVRNIKAVLDLDFVDFVLKPSTGKMATKLKPDNDHATDELLGICRLASDEHSYNLIAWADVVIVTHSSIFLEVLLQGKTFLYPKHFTELTGFFEEYKACWQVDSQAELIDALRKSYETPGYQPYSQKSVDALCEMMVLGHKKGRDVLADHRKFILEAEKNAV